MKDRIGACFECERTNEPLFYAGRSNVADACECCYWEWEYGKALARELMTKHVCTVVLSDLTALLLLRRKCLTCRCMIELGRTCWCCEESCGSPDPAL